MVEASKFLIYTVTIYGPPAGSLSPKHPWLVQSLKTSLVMRIALATLFLSASVQAAPLCASVFVDETSINLKIAELAGLLVSVRAFPENIALSTDFRKKYLEVEEEAGRSIKAEVQRSGEAVDRKDKSEIDRRQEETESLSQWTRTKRYPLPEGPTHAIYLDDRTAIIAQPDRIELLNLADLSKKSIPVAGTHSGSALALSIDRQSVFVGSHSIKKVNLMTGEVKSSATLDAKVPISDHLIASKSGRFVVGSGATWATIQDAEFAEPPIKIDTKFHLRSINIADSERYLLLITLAGTPTLYDLQLKQPVDLDDVNTASGPWNDAVFLPSRDIVLVTTNNGRVFEYDLASRQIKYLPISCTYPNWIRISPDGTKFLLGSLKDKDGKYFQQFEVFDRITGALIPLPFPTEWRNVALQAESEDHRRLAFFAHTSSLENFMIVNLEHFSLTFSQISTLPPSHAGSIIPNGRFAPNGQRLLLSPLHDLQPDFFELH